MMQVARPDLQMMKWNVSLPFNYFKGLLMVNHPPVEGTYTLGWGQVNDLVINVDGLTQIDKDKAEFYTNRMLEDKTKHFYSVNREIDSFTISEICSLARVSRTPFWHRRGYVEEDYFGGL